MSMIEGSMFQMGDKRVANVTFTNGRKELSLTIDNGSMCRTEKLFRADMRCFNNGVDVTSEVFGCGKTDIVSGDVGNMAKGMAWMQRQDWGFEAQRAI